MAKSLTEEQKAHKLAKQRERRQAAAAAKKAGSSTSGSSSDWTPERRAAQSKAMKAKYATGWHPTKGKKLTRKTWNKHKVPIKDMTPEQKRAYWRKQYHATKKTLAGKAKPKSTAAQRRAWKEQAQRRRDRVKAARKSKPGGARPGAGR